MLFDPCGLATAIGSFPHQDPAEACKLILNTISQIPTWPQLPNISFLEQMEIQYSENMVGIVIDNEKQRMYIDTRCDDTSGLEKLYENFLALNYDYFKISEQFSRGIYQLEKQLSKIDCSAIQYMKSQITGPNTFGLTVVDENKKAIYYNEMYRDMVVKGLVMKARWLLQRFKSFGFNQICFVDEPILSAFGSSTYVSVQRTDIVSCLKEVIDAIHDDGALAGTHCCGNTEWPILIDAGVDIISFDAYDYGDTIGYYATKIKSFLENGGILAWGIVPTSEKIISETTESLVDKLTTLIANLESKGIDKNLIWKKCLLTPSCGTGSLSPELSEKVMTQLKDVSDIIKGRIE